MSTTLSLRPQASSARHVSSLERGDWFWHNGSLWILTSKDPIEGVAISTGAVGEFDPQTLVVYVEHVSIDTTPLPF